MPSADDPDVHPPLNRFDQLRHDLKTPLTTISGHAQLLHRVVRHSPSLPDDERARMLEGLARIETTVRAMVTMIDALGREDTHGSLDPSPEREDPGGTNHKPRP
jgi:signal transduction histidine kinase